MRVLSFFADAAQYRNLNVAVLFRNASSFMRLARMTFGSNSLPLLEDVASGLNLTRVPFFLPTPETS